MGQTSGVAVRAGNSLSPINNLELGRPDLSLNTQTEDHYGKFIKFLANYNVLCGGFEDKHTHIHHHRPRN